MTCYFVKIGENYVLNSIQQRYAIESGVCSVNGKPAKIGTVIKNGDRIE